MAIYRPIQIKFWQDKFVLKLTPEQKYFYMYLMTNSKTKQCGIYELPMSVLCLETGYNQDTVTKLLKNFIEFDKIKYDFEKEEILLKNWIKYNSINNINIMKCVIGELKEIKNKQFYEEWVEIFIATNKGLTRRYDKEIKDYVEKDYTSLTLEGLDSPLVDAYKKETETETETKLKTETEVVLPFLETKQEQNKTAKLTF